MQGEESLKSVLAEVHGMSQSYRELRSRMRDFLIVLTLFGIVVAMAFVNNALNFKSHPTLLSLVICAIPLAVVIWTSFEAIKASAMWYDYGQKLKSLARLEAKIKELQFNEGGGHEMQGDQTLGT